ncbi:MAG TPA: RDD family protein [Verrucomicrobiae bacterium]|jgi:uncharacterized RDD family membrane protein YckC
MKICDCCGHQYPNEAVNCSHCGTELQTPLTVVKLTKAGFWLRVLARIIDISFIVIVAIIVGVFCGMVFYSLSASGLIAADWEHRIREFSFASIGLGLLGKILYEFFCEGIHGATLGKLCCKIRVVREDGTPSNLKGALIRSLAYYLDSQFFGAVGYTLMSKSPLNQRYGDKWGKTIVIKTNEIAPESQRTLRRFLLGLSLGTGCSAITVAIGLVLKVLYPGFL